MPIFGSERRTRWMNRWMGYVLPRVFRRVVNGRAPQPSWLPRRLVTAVSGDVDLDAGAGAVWVVSLPGAATAETYTALVELFGDEWQMTGYSSASGAQPPPGRKAAGGPGQVGMIELSGGAGGRSDAHFLRHPLTPDTDPRTIPWVGTNELHLATEVDHLLVGERRIEVPGHGNLLLVWKSAATSQGGTRPLIVALARDGSELSRIGPHDSLDTYTWANLS